MIVRNYDAANDFTEISVRLSVPLDESSDPEIKDIREFFIVQDVTILIAKINEFLKELVQLVCAPETAPLAILIIRRLEANISEARREIEHCRREIAAGSTAEEIRDREIEKLESRASDSVPQAFSDHINSLPE